MRLACNKPSLIMLCRGASLLFSTIALQLISIESANAQDLQQLPAAPAVNHSKIEKLGSDQGYVDVLFSKGDVMYRSLPGQDNVRLATGDKIRFDGSIQTGIGGFASLRITDGTIFNVQPDSHVRLVRKSCPDSVDACIAWIITSDSGIWLPRISAIAPTRFTIETPFQSAAVRGPSFYIDELQVERLEVGIPAHPDR